MAKNQLTTPEQDTWNKALYLMAQPLIEACQKAGNTEAAEAYAKMYFASLQWVGKGK